ncbi:MAG: hypothetical protein JXA16_10865, partial [Bacteroidales bacterium]|nr:hypothetical protein [Bacteroidales bacterium]
RIRFENAENQPTIAEKLNEYGYTPEKLAQGKALKAKAEEAYNLKKKEENESIEIFNKFENKQKEISESYTKDRKITKIAYSKTSEVLKKVGINGAVPKSYVKWQETVKTFYNIAKENTEIQSKLATLNVNIEHITEMCNSITELEHLRADYLREKGESQDATNLKDKAFAELENWMREFKAIAKIALDEHSQLLEALKI